MSLYNCNPDDPWTRNNFIHEFGHILIHRASGILRNWEAIEQQFDVRTQERILEDPFVGFSRPRENRFRITLEDYQTFTEAEATSYKATILTEDVADMFLNWVVGGFPDDEVGRRRREFVEGIVSEFDDGTQIENIGMKGWAAQAGRATRRSCSATAQANLQTAWLVSLIGDKCLNMPVI